MKFYIIDFKKWIFIILINTFFFFTHFGLFADTYSSSTAGTTVSTSPSFSDETGNLSAAIFFTTHFQFGNSFTANTGISIATDNILANDFFQETPAYFTINEISGTYNFYTPIVNCYLTAFSGTFEAPGTDIFGKKYLGIQNIISPLLYPQTELESVPIYPIDGLGLAIAGKFTTPIAASLYFSYKNKVESTNTDGTENYTKYINCDTRIAGVSDNFFIDSSLGTSFPLETEVIDDELHIITTINLHAMTTMVIGGNPYTNMFIQAGLLNLQTQPTDGDDYVSLDDIYIFLEPRFSTKSLRFSFSLFSIPEDLTDSLESIDNSVGTAITIVSNPLILFGGQGNIGGRVCASIPNLATVEYSIDNLDVQIEPYLDLALENDDIHSTLHTALHVYPLRYNDLGTMFLYTLGYKLQI